MRQKKAIRIGLTGSIGMGKTTTAKLFREQGCAVFDADAAVHEIYNNEGIDLLKPYFPECIEETINRKKLSETLRKHPEKLHLLENLIHPLVYAKEEKAYAEAILENISIFIIDSPLLIEAKRNKSCHALCVVTTSPHMQRERVLNREGMTEEKFLTLLKRQMPDKEKRTHAHFLIFTHTLEGTKKTVKSLVKTFKALPHA